MNVPITMHHKHNPKDAQKVSKSITQMNKEEILALMKWYGFKDVKGHSLVLCKDFSQLVDEYIELRDKKQQHISTQEKMLGAVNEQ